MDEGRKRVGASILAAWKLAQFDGGKRLSATVAAIADAVRRAEEICSADLSFYFGIQVKGLCSSFPSGLHFLQSNFSQTEANPSIRRSERKSISKSTSNEQKLV